MNEYLHPQRLKAMEMNAERGYSAVAMPRVHLAVRDSIDVQLAPLANVQIPFQKADSFNLVTRTTRDPSYHDSERRQRRVQDLEPEKGVSPYASTGSLHTAANEPHAKDLCRSVKHVSFQFVDIHEPSGKTNPATSTQIRAHVMRRFHQKRRTIQGSKSKAFITAFGKDSLHIRATETVHSCVHKTVVVGDGSVPSQRTFSLGEYRQQWSRHTVTPDFTTPGLDSTPGIQTDPKRLVICISCQQLLVEACQKKKAPLLAIHETEPQNISDTWSFDPFSSTAMPISRRMHELLHHYIFWHTTITNPRIYGKGNFLNPVIVDFIPLCLTDEANIYAMAAFGAFSQHALRKRLLISVNHNEIEELNRAYAEAAFYLFEGIRIMNTKLKNIREALSVTSLTAAAILGSCTSFNHDSSQVITHHDGLLRMIELRGGIDTLPRYVAHQFSRVDSNLSFMRHSGPRLLMYRSRFRSNGPLISAVDVCNGSITEFLADSPGFLQTHPLRSPFPNTKLEEFLWKELFSVACDLQNLTYILETHMREPSKIDAVQREYFEDTYAAVQHSLVAFPYPISTGLVKSTVYYRQHCWRLAALLYFNMAIRTWEPSSNFVRKTIEDLISSLRASHSSQGYSSSSDVLLWILSMGSCGACGAFEKGWLVLELKSLTRMLGLQAFDEFQALLKSFIYRDSTFERPLREIWDEIAP